MSTPGPDDPTAPSQPSPELGGLDPKDLLNAGLETVPPVTLPPRLVDSDATMAVSRPLPTQPRNDAPELPLPEELTNLLPHGNYHVESFLGQGGMGAVYKGMQVRLKRPVAIKIMRRDFGKDHDFEARFEREAQAMAKLNHPNIVSVIDFGEAGSDYLYIVMELIDGADMMDVIRGGQMTQEMALSLLPQICDALQFAHDHGIVHRDIKPSNIMLTRDGRIKMADFGLAKHFDAENSFRTQTGTGMGTPDYAAPEQFSPDSPIDHRADIYALGVMIYQMITGQLPRGAWKPPSQRAEVSPQWDSIVSRAMQSDPSDRYQQASEVKTDVSSIPLAGSRVRKDVADAPQIHALAGAATKSRAPLLLGLITGALVIAVGAFFALRDGGEGRAAGPPAAANGPGITTAEKAPATPNAALAGASALPIAAPPLPESAWKPLFTEKEWQLPYQATKKLFDGSTVPAGRSFKEGALQVQNNGFLKPQPAANAAIRARIVIQQVVDAGAVVARRSVAAGHYRWGTATNNRQLQLTHFNPETNRSTMLGKHELAAPLRQGDKLDLELRVQGNRLVALANGAVVIDTQDDRLKAAGECGIEAHDAWFESVEVQPLPAAVTPASIAAPALPESGWKPLFTEKEWRESNDHHEFVEGLLHVKRLKFLPKTQQPSADGAIRAKVLIRKGANDVCVFVRKTPATSGYKLMLRPQTGTVYLSRDEGGVSQSLGMQKFAPDPRQANDGVFLELRAQGSHLTALVDGVVLIEAEDNTLKAAGEWGITANEGWFESVEVQPLPAAETQPPWTDALAAWWQGGTQRGGWVREKDGSARLTVTGPSGIHLGKMGSTTPPIYKDQAVRARFRLGDSPYLHLGVCRPQPTEGQARGYYAAFAAGKSSITLTLDSPGMASHAELAAVPLPKGLDRAATHTMELRYANQLLTLILDGQTLYEKPHTQYTQGYPMLNARQGAIVESLEVADLGGGAVLTSPSLPGSESWQNALADSAQLRFSEGAEITPDGLLLPRKSSGVTVYAGQERGDGAIRLRATADGLRQGLRARIDKNNSHYKLDIPDQTTLKLQRWDNVARQSTLLREFPLPSGFNPLAEHEIELRAAGSTLTVSLDRQTLGTVTDAVLKTGSFGVSVGEPITRPVLINSLEVLDSGVSTSPNLPASSSSVATATKDAPFTNTLGMKFVPVPGTKALFGIWPTRVQDYAAFAKAQEAAGKKVDGAWKVQEKDGVPVGHEADHPVVGVSWDDAQAFCQWLTAKETAEGQLPPGMKYRLPSDEEWSWAAGMPPEPGATPEEKDGKNSVDFPWGKDWPLTKQVGNYADESFHAKFRFPDAKEPERIKNEWIKDYNDGFATTSPVGSFPANPYGICDMGGNIWQWCEDWWNAEQKDRVVRGASWGSSGRSNLLSSLRNHRTPTIRSHPVGFRVVLVGTSSASSGVSLSPNLPVSKSSDPKFPPGQWVKLFTKPEDLPADLRKPDSGVSFEDGWIRGGPPERKLILPPSLKANYGVRATFKRSAGRFARLGIRHDFRSAQPYYQIRLGSSEKLIMQATSGVNQNQLVWTIDIPKIADGSDYRLELAAVGNLSVARYGGIIKTMDIKDAPQGGAQITGLEDIRDIEVMNLDGLSEAEALRLLGVDEQGNDLRGKQSSAGLKPAQPSPTPSAPKSASSTSIPATKPTGDGLKPTNTLPPAAPVR